MMAGDWFLVAISMQYLIAAALYTGGGKFAMGFLMGGYGVAGFALLLARA